MRKAKSQQAEISVGNLEVVSEESFLKRLKGISSCQDCKQKRIKCATNNNNTNGAAKRAPKNKRKFMHPPKTRSNLPIVIKLSDSLRQPRGQHGGRHNNSSKLWPPVSESCTTADYSRSGTPVHHNHYKNGHHRHKRNEYRDKNFNAMISYIEKALPDLSVNLNRCCSNATLPNNYCCDDCPVGTYRPFDNSNLDIICNDLTGKVLIDEESASITSSSDSHDEEYHGRGPNLSTRDLQHLVDYTTDFAVTCFGSDLCRCSQCYNGGMSKRKCKAKDVIVSTGGDSDGPSSPVTSSSEDLPSSHDDHDTPSSTQSSSDTEDSDSTDITLRHDHQGSLKQSKPTPTAKPARISNVRSHRSKPTAFRVSTTSSDSNTDFRKDSTSSTSSQIFTITSKANSTNEVYNDAVYIDLTGTDVEIAVFYHSKPADTDRHWCYTSSSSSRTSSSTSSSPSTSSTSSTPSPPNSASPASSTSSSFLYQMPSVPSAGFWYYPHIPFFYYPHPPTTAATSFIIPPPVAGVAETTAHAQSRYNAPIVSIPRPLCIPRDKDILLSTKTCMIPAQEIDKFTTTQPAQRPWIELANPTRDQTAAVFTVMCYNVLCDKYCTRQQYGYCPTWALSWEYRKKGIIDEIRHCSADIISLQEVETDQFHNFFLPELKQDGYEGVFANKSRARTMSEVERKHVDGCAIFFRTSKFSLVKKHLMEFNQLAMASAEGSHDMLNRVMTKDNIGLAALLETKEGVYENGLMPSDSHIRQPLLVATAHVHWDPEFSDVKLIQTMMLMSDLKNFIEETTTSLRPGANPKSTDVNALPLILCADLNSLPESGVIEYLTSGKIAANHVDFKDIGYEECMQKMGTMDATSENLCHDFRLSRSYDSDIMPYTNYTYDFKGVIDYIFYSRDYLTTLGILGPIDPDWFASNKVIGCPHPHIPSDHLSLLSQFEMPVPLKKSQSSSGGHSAFPSSRR